MPHETPAAAAAPAGDSPESATVVCPQWFERFIDDRQIRKPAAHTLRAYRQDFAAIAAHMSDPIERLAPDAITKDTVLQAFSTFARDHSASSIRRCWSTWNVLCTYLFTSELIAANPMPHVARPKAPKALPKALESDTVESLVTAVSTHRAKPRVTDWPERDLAIIQTLLLAGLRANELEGTDIADIRVTDNGSGVIRVRGKGGKERHVPVEEPYLDILRTYLETRDARIPLPHNVNRHDGDPLKQWPGNAPLFVTHKGERITRGVLQSRVAIAFKLAGPQAQPVAGALVHGFRHTYATELAETGEVSVYTLMQLLGHESMATSQRYVLAAGVETREAAAKNPLYKFAKDHRKP